MVTRQKVVRAPRCTRCGQAIHRGQLYLPRTRAHVACPSEAQVERARRWGRL
jgi:hypothetical protein